MESDYNDSHGQRRDPLSKASAINRQVRTQWAEEILSGWRYEEEGGSLSEYTTPELLVTHPRQVAEAWEAGASYEPDYDDDDPNWQDRPYAAPSMNEGGYSMTEEEAEADAREDDDD